MFTRSVAATQKMNLLNSFEEANLPPGFESGEEPTPEIGEIQHRFFVLNIRKMYV